MNCSNSDATDLTCCRRFKTDGVRVNNLAVSAIAAVCVALLNAVPAEAHDTGVPHAHPHVAGGIPESLLFVVMLVGLCSAIAFVVLKQSANRGANATIEDDI